MATEVGNIYVGLYVDVGETRKFASAASAIDSQSRRMSSALAGTTAATNALRRGLGGINQTARFRIASDSLRDLARANDEVSKLRAAIVGLSAVAGLGLTGAFSVASLVQYADKAKLLSNQLKTVTTDSANFAATQSALYDVAQRTRSSLEGTINLYARTARATENFGYSQEKLLKITETVQKAFAVGGATPQEASGAALQLSQAIASNRFGGEEYRSVSENAPVLLNAIAKSLKVDLGQLRQMSMDGKLTAEVVTKAILESADQVNAKFAKMTPTVAQAFTTLDNALTRYIGDVDNTYGITNTLAGALMGMANNFEEIAKYIGIATAALGAFYLASKTVRGSIGLVGGIRAKSAGNREIFNNLLDQRTEIGRSIASNKARQAELSSSTYLTEPRNRDASAFMARALGAQKNVATAQQTVADLEAKRNAVVDKLGLAQNAGVSRLQREVELARERVRQDQQRVIEAQAAAAAEERNLAARRAQALQKADARVGAAQGGLSAAQSKVGAAQANYVEQQAKARADLEAKIAERQSKLVQSQIGLRSTQSQIADLRGIKNLEGFDSVYGAQYRGLLKSQQQALISTGKLRSEIGDLQGQLTKLRAGENTTVKLASAMRQYEAAVKQAGVAQTTLQKAMESRAAVAAKGGSEFGVTDKEQKAIAAYEKSINNLQARMKDLKQATSVGFDSAPVRGFVKQVEALDQRISEAKVKLASATAAASSAFTATPGQQTATLAAQQKAQAELNVLMKEANLLAEKQAAIQTRIVATQRQLTLLRRIGSGFLDFFGGGIGLGITAALTAATLAIGHFAAEGQKTVQNVQNLKEELNQMGLLSDQLAGKVDKAAASLDKMASEQLRNKVRQLKDELARQKDERWFWERWSQGDQGETLGDVRAQIEDLAKQTFNMRARGLPKNAETRTAINELRSIASLAEKGKTPTEDLLKRLDEIAKKDLGAGVDALIAKLRDAIPYVDALKKGIDKVGEVNAVPDWQRRMDATATTRTQAAENARTQEWLVDRFAASDKSEQMLTAYERELKRLTDEVIKDFEKANPGQIMSRMDAIPIAEQRYISQTASTGLLNLIASRESGAAGYNATVDNGKWTGGPVNLTSMSIGEVLSLQKQMLADPGNKAKYGGVGSSAVGRYQIVSSTLKGLISKLGISMDEQFTPEMQDRLATELIRQTGGDPGKLRGTWLGLNGVPDAKILEAFQKTSEGMPKLDENVQKFKDTIKELNLEKAIAGLNETQKAILQTGQSAGASDEEIKQYVAAVTSGNLDQVPEKFKQIANSLEAITNAKLPQFISNIREQNLESLLSSVDQKTVEWARSMGMAEEKIRSFVQAAASGNLQGISSDFAALRAEAQKMENISFGKDVISGALTDIRGALEDGKITWREWGQIALNVLNKVIDRLQNQLVDALFASSSNTGAASSGGGGFLSGLFGLFGGGGSQAALAKSGKIFGLFDSGGYTGPGGIREPAGVVHKGEYVMSAAAVDRLGIGNLEAIHQLGLKGYAGGGYVSSPSLPSSRSTSLSSQIRPSLAAKMKDIEPPRGGDKLTVQIDGANGDDHVRMLVEQGVSTALYNQKERDRRGETGARQRQYQLQKG